MCVKLCEVNRRWEVTPLAHVLERLTPLTPTPTQAHTQPAAHSATHPPTQVKQGTVSTRQLLQIGLHHRASAVRGRMLLGCRLFAHLRTEVPRGSLWCLHDQGE